MAVSKLLLAALGLGGVALIATRKPQAKRKTASGTIVVLPMVDHPICRKYPGGIWLPSGINLKGWPRDKPGWNDDDVKAVTDAVDAAFAKPHSWGSMSEARQISFEITRSIIQKFCPSKEMPSSRVTLENHLKRSIALRHMWERIDNMVWNRLVGAGT